MNKFITVDIGTSKISAFVVRDKQVRSIKDSHSEGVFHPIISFVDGLRKFGPKAQITDDSKIITQSLEVLNEKYDDIKDKILFDPVVDCSGNATYEIKWKGVMHNVMPESIVAYILKNVVAWTPFAIDTITAVVPDSYSTEKKKAMKEAAKAYDLTLYFLSSRMSHLYDFIAHNKDFLGIAVPIDFGNNHFTISCYEITEERMHKKKSVTIPVGGRDLTIALFDYLLKRAEDEIQDEEVKKVLEQIKNDRKCKASFLFYKETETVKEVLSNAEEATFKISEMPECEKLSLNVKREEFEKLPKFIEVQKTIKDAIVDFKTDLEINDNSGITFQGGSSFIPAIRQTVSDALGVALDKIKFNLSPTDCFAEGAAFYKSRTREKVTKSDPHVIAITKSTVSKIKDQEAEINDFVNPEEELNEAKEELTQFFRKFKKLVHEPSFNDMFQDKSYEVMGLYQELSIYMDDFDDISNYKECQKKLAYFRTSYSEATGHDRIILPK